MPKKKLITRTLNPALPEDFRPEQVTTPETGNI